MKKTLIYFLLLLSVVAVPLLKLQPVHAGSATVTVIVKHANGAPVTVGTSDITCAGGAMVDGNFETILSKGAANSNGVATITIIDPFNDQVPISCKLSEILLRAGCIQSYNYSPASFIASTGTNTTVNVTQVNSCAYPQTQTTPTPTPTPTQPSNPAPIVEKALELSEIASVSLPDKYSVEGSLTTDLSELDVESSKCVDGFILDDPEVGKIEFLECVDLSSSEIADKFSRLDEHLNLSSTGILIESLPELEKPSKITLYGLEFAQDQFDYITINDNGESISMMGTYNDGKSVIEMEKLSEIKIKSGLDISNYDSEVEQDSITIKGGVNLLSTHINILFVGTDKSIEVEADEDGQFEQKLELVEGMNAFVVVADLGEMTLDEEKVNVEYSPLSAFESIMDNNYARVGLFVGVPVLLCLFGLSIGGGIYFLKKRNLK
jgi:hypothetical protein